MSELDSATLSTSYEDLKNGLYIKSFNSERFYIKHNTISCMFSANEGNTISIKILDGGTHCIKCSTKEERDILFDQLLEIICV